MKLYGSYTSLFALLLSFNAYSLVDYTEASAKKYNTKRPQAKNAIQRVQAATPSKKKNSPTGFFDLGMNYETMDVKSSETNGKVSKVNFIGHFQTTFNVFVDVTHWAASTSQSKISNKSELQQGNPKLILGFNWLRFGQPVEMATVDFITGVSMAGESDFATSRTDKIVGIETAKRFYNFALALGYELSLTGTPDEISEVAVGSISILKASLGWRVSNDIRFVIDGGNVRISKSTNIDRTNILEQDETFSYVSPKIALGISPSVLLDIGATFRSKKPVDQESLIGAKLWGIPGAYGNSINAGLNISI